MMKRRALMVDVADGDSVRIGEARRAGDDAHAKSDEAFARGVAAQRRRSTSRTWAMTAGKIDAVRTLLTPKRAPLRTAWARSAAAIRALATAPRRSFEAFAAHAACFDQHDRYAHSGGGRSRGRKPARAGADHADVRSERSRPLAPSAGRTHRN